jgi:hypothetical protein
MIKLSSQSGVGGFVMSLSIGNIIRAIPKHMMKKLSLQNQCNFKL